jgi:hypothetical protein
MDKYSLDGNFYKRPAALIPEALTKVKHFNIFKIDELAAKLKIKPVMPLQPAYLPQNQHCPNEVRIIKQNADRSNQHYKKENAFIICNA